MYTIYAILCHANVIMNKRSFSKVKRFNRRPKTRPLTFTDHTVPYTKVATVFFLHLFMLQPQSFACFICD